MKYGDNRKYDGNYRGHTGIHIYIYQGYIHIYIYISTMENNMETTVTTGVI